MLMLDPGGARNLLRNPSSYPVCAHDGRNDKHVITNAGSSVWTAITLNLIIVHPGGFLCAGQPPRKRIQDLRLKALRIMQQIRRPVNVEPDSGLSSCCWLDRAYRSCLSATGITAFRL